jgi:hypothetical protein
VKPLTERQRIEWLAARYLDAYENDDVATQEQLWKLAETDPALVTAFEQVHADVLEEQAQAEAEQMRAHVLDAVQQHLPAATVVTETPARLTVASVAEELAAYPVAGLPAAAHALNEALRRSTEALPADLGLPQVIAWGEARFGPAAKAYWQAFRATALKVRMRANAETEFQLAARRQRPNPEERR